MQLRCYSCHTPFTVGRAIVDYSLNIMEEDQLVHFDFRCPKCKKATRVSKEQLMHAAPGWEYEPTESAAKEKEGKEKETETKPAAKPKTATKAKPKTTEKSKPKPKAKK